ncbi:hypothetical protein BDR04DRAFT_1099231 [Suillus decipiens]|nr:hypothetical protein BDR04DRAFT_1099231 [Suillus decipiens]
MHSLASQVSLFSARLIYILRHPRDPITDTRMSMVATIYQRSADILTRILVDPVFASHIRSLSVYAIVSDASHILTFKTGCKILVCGWAGKY